MTLIQSIEVESGALLYGQRIAVQMDLRKRIKQPHKVN